MEKDKRIYRCNRCKTRVAKFIPLVDGKMDETYTYDKCESCGSDRVELVSVELPEQKSFECYNCDACDHYGHANFPVINGVIDKNYRPTCKNCGSRKTRWCAVRGSEGSHVVESEYKCRDCNHTGMSMGEQIDGKIDQSTFDPCSNCGSTNLHWIIPVPNIDRVDELEFPYYDRGLGQMLHSKKHRLEVCKQKGVVPIDGDIDFSPTLSKIREKNAKEDAIVAELEDEMENAPHYAGFRKEREREEKENKTKPASEEVIDTSTL